MKFLPFGHLFPELAPEETRSITVWGQKDLPDGEYGFLDYYCEDPDCDCRRTMVLVFSEFFPGKILATISYGWKSKAFYREWMGWDDEKELREFKGPALVAMSPQSDLAPALLRHFRGFLKDSLYVERLKRHYRMFKDALRN